MADARKAVARQVKFPPGYYVTWSGQFEYMERAVEKMKIVDAGHAAASSSCCCTSTSGAITETLIVMLSVPFALVGGVWLMWLLGLQPDRRGGGGLHRAGRRGGGDRRGDADLSGSCLGSREGAVPPNGRARRPRGDLYAAVMEGAVERVRPKMMTVVAIMAGLLPIMWGTGTGSEVMSRIAAPMVGGMISSTVLTLVVIPAIYALVKEWEIRRAARAKTAHVPSAHLETAIAPAE